MVEPISRQIQSFQFSGFTHSTFQLNGLTHANTDTTPIKSNIINFSIKWYYYQNVFSCYFWQNSIFGNVTNNVYVGVALTEPPVYKCGPRLQTDLFIWRMRTVQNINMHYCLIYARSRVDFLGGVALIFMEGHVPPHCTCGDVTVELSSRVSWVPAKTRYVLLGDVTVEWSSRVTWTSQWHTIWCHIKECRMCQWLRFK